MKTLLATSGLTANKIGLSISVSSVFAYLQIDQEAFYLLTVLMTFDFITGLSKSYNSDIKWESKTLKKGLMNKIMTIIAILTLALLGRSLGQDSSSIIAFFMALFALNEGYSILGNIASIRTGKDVKEYDAGAIIITMMLDWVGGALKDKLKKNDTKSESS